MAIRQAPFPTTHLLLTTVLSTILLILSLQKRDSLIINPINYIFAPLRVPFSSLNSAFVKTHLFIKQIPHQGRLIKDLQRQNATLATSANKALEKELENEALKKLVNAKGLSPRPHLTAKVIGLSRFAYLNQGSNNGVKEGLPVIVDNILIGIIKSVSSSTSKVALLTDQDTNLTASTLSGSTGQLVFNNTTLKLDQVLQKESLTIQEPVFTKGSELVPNGLLIGTIKQINENEASVYKEAEIKEAASIHDQEIVFIILE